MRNLLFVCVACLAFMSCEKAELTEKKANTKEVQFVFSGIKEEYSTRATLQSVSMTDVWIWEGTTLLAHKVSTDEDFGAPSIQLTYGSHDLTFVASKAQQQSFLNGIWSCAKVGDTFSKTMNVTVSWNSSSSRQVQLTRRSAQITFVIEDAIPANIKSMVVSVDNHFSLLSDLTASNYSVYSTSVDISAKAGMTGYSPVVNVLPVSATDEEDCDVTIEFKDASGNVLYYYDRTVKIKANRNTNLKGNYFAGGSNELSVDSEWLDALNVPLFE